MRWLRGTFGASALGAVLLLPLQHGVAEVAPSAVPPFPPQLDPAVAPRDVWVWPLSPLPTVIDTFHPPPQPWAAGHRGVDLLGVVGQPVAAIQAGTVTFAGMVAGRGVVVVDHGSVRSTYQSVAPRVQRSDQVAAGQVIATLAAVQSHCPPRACLHLGVRRGDDYVDPLTLLSPRPVRLKPLTGAAASAASSRPDAALAARPPLAPSASGSTSPLEESRLPTQAAAAAAAVVAAAAAGQRWRRRFRRADVPAGRRRATVQS